MKIVINRCYGGFSLSEQAQKMLNINSAYDFNDDRANPKLVRAVEKLGQDANGQFAELKIVEIPDDVEWEIEEYDGIEWIAEKHRTWS